MIDISGSGAFLRLDVRKGEHHATAVTPASKSCAMPSKRADRPIQ
ncbi:hypothetical protein [Streptomyces sp. WM4235]|nr:hypothetical protein [Streptomyces sp. WM4235]